MKKLLVILTLLAAIGAGWTWTDTASAYTVRIHTRFSNGTLPNPAYTAIQVWKRNCETCGAYYWSSKHPNSSGYADFDLGGSPVNCSRNMNDPYNPLNICFYFDYRASYSPPCPNIWWYSAYVSAFISVHTNPPQTFYDGFYATLAYSSPAC